MSPTPRRVAVHHEATLQSHDSLLIVYAHCVRSVHDVWRRCCRPPVGTRCECCARNGTSGSSRLQVTAASCTATGRYSQRKCIFVFVGVCPAYTLPTDQRAHHLPRRSLRGWPCCSAYVTTPKPQKTTLHRAATSRCSGSRPCCPSACTPRAGCRRRAWTRLRAALDACGEPEVLCVCVHTVAERGDG